MRSLDWITLLCLLQSTLKAGAADSPIYPDLSCHEGYDGEQANKEIRAAMVTCEEALKTEMVLKKCFQQCMLISVGVLKTNVKLNKKRGISRSLKKEYFSSEVGQRTAHELGVSIRKQCKASYKKVKKLACDQWTDFYDCVDKILSCGSKPPNPEP